MLLVSAAATSSSSQSTGACQAALGVSVRQGLPRGRYCPLPGTSTDAYNCLRFWHRSRSKVAVEDKSHPSPAHFGGGTVTGWSGRSATRAAVCASRCVLP